MKKALVLLAVLSFGVLFAGMGPNPEELGYKEGRKVKVTGVLRLVGNEPFTRLSIRVTLKTNHLDVFLSNELKKIYQNLVARDVETEGIFHIETFTSANRKYKFREYSLSNVTEMKVVKASEETNE